MFNFKSKRSIHFKLCRRVPQTPKKAGHTLRPFRYHQSQDDADQARTSLVKNALQRFPQLALRIGGHPLQLGVQVLPCDLVEAAAEDCQILPVSPSNCWSR